MTKVTILETKEVATFNDEYAERLIEQGKAVLYGDEKAGEKAEAKAAKAEEPKKAEEAANGKKK